jgi:hypothetical protein
LHPRRDRRARVPEYSPDGQVASPSRFRPALFAILAT